MIIKGIPVPSVTRAQMQEIDKLMINDYHISLVQMMENAGRNLAELTRQMLGGEVYKKQVLVLCGGGNNGGGGMVAARHLVNWGAKLCVAVSKNTLKELPTVQRNILNRMRVEFQDQPFPFRGALILDAMIGYGLQGKTRGKIRDWIIKANDSGIPILALDMPSGLDADNGKPTDECIKATATLTLALPKKGLLHPSAKHFVGDLYLADIGVPCGLYRQIGLAVPLIFKNSTYISLTDY